MAMYAKVRRMRLRDGLSISEIARRRKKTDHEGVGFGSLQPPLRSEVLLALMSGLGCREAIPDALCGELDVSPRQNRMVHDALARRAITGGAGAV